MEIDIFYIFLKAGCAQKLYTKAVNTVLPKNLISNVIVMRNQNDS